MTIKNANNIIKDNYAEYIKYTTEFRNYPSIIDGCKPSHRRCIHQIYTECPKHFVKSATAIGAVVKAHPHPSSIYGTLVPLTQKDSPFPIFDGQGNFGSTIPQSEPAAERYTEIKISDLSSKIFESFSNFVDTVEGDLNNIEPKALATFLPLSLIHGTYSIPVGMSTVDTPALSATDLCDYAIEILKSGDINSTPDVFIRPNLGNVQIKSTRQEWKNMLLNGFGKIQIAPRVNIIDNKKLEIVALPESKSIEHVNKILESELSRDVIDVIDETTTTLSIIVEIRPYKQVKIEDLAKRLNSKLTANKNYRFIYSDINGAAVHCGVYTNMRYCLQYLVKCANRWAEKSVNDLQYKLAILEVIEQLRKDENVLQKLVKATKTAAIKLLIDKYNIDKEQANSVLSKPISYLTSEHAGELKELKVELKQFKDIKENIYTYLVNKYTELKSEIEIKFKNRPVTTFLSQKSRKIC